MKPAEAAGLDVRVLRAGSEREIEAAFSTLNQARVDAFLVLSDPVYTNRRNEVARLQNSYKIPAIYGSREIVVAGGLMSYGASIEGGLSSSGRLCGSHPQGR